MPRIRPVAVSVALLVLGGTTTAPARAESARGLLATAIGHVERGEDAAAIEAFDTVLEQDETLVEAWSGRAAARLRLGDLDGAVADLDAALRAAPGAIDLYEHRAEAQLRRGDLDAARADLDRALGLDAGRGATWYRRGIVFEMQGALEHAVRDYTSALEREPSLLPALVRRAEARGALGDVDGAVNDWSAVLAAAPNDAAAFARRSAARLAAGDASGALEDARSGVALDDGDSRVHRALGRARWSLGHLDAAQSSFTRAVELAPEDPEFRLDRATLLLAMGRGGAAIADLGVAWRTGDATSRCEATLRRFLARAAGGDAVTGAAELMRAMSRTPDDPGFRAAGHFLLGDISAPALLFVSRDRSFPGVAGAHHLVAATLLLEDRGPEATEHLRRCLESAAPDSRDHLAARTMLDRLESGAAFAVVEP